MDQPPDRQSQPLAWPRFAAAGVLLAVILAALWMAVAVHRIRATRQLFESPPPATSPPKSNAAMTNAVAGGDPERGRRVFFEKPEANCAKCHPVSGPGGNLGPSLEGVGSRLARDLLFDSILKPNAHTVAGYESVIVLLTNNQVVSGFLKEESLHTLRVQTAEEGLVQVPKTAIQLRQAGLSPMPEGMGQLLTRQEIDDLVAYLATLQ